MRGGESLGKRGQGGRDPEEKEKEVRDSVRQSERGGEKERARDELFHINGN